LISGAVLSFFFTLSFSLTLFLDLPLFVLLLVWGFSFLLDDPLKLSLAFALLAVLHGVLDSNFKLWNFIVHGLIKGQIEKPNGQILGLIVMSH
jgi:hypothetical protein